MSEVSERRGLDIQGDVTIFVSVASYRDQDCTGTVLDLFSKASVPSRVHVGVCLQVEIAAEDLNLPEGFAYHNNVSSMRMHAIEAKGPTFARYLCSLLYKDQTYYMQIDAHMRFAPGWDQTVISMIEALPSKAILSTYPTDMKHYEKFIERGDFDFVPIMQGIKFDPRGIPRPQAAVMRKKPAEPVPGVLVAAGMFFVRGKEFIRDVPFDRDLDDLFGGEEVLLSARLFTSGFQVYNPNVPLAFHRYHRPGEPRYWERFKNDTDSVQRMKYILGLSERKPVHLTRLLDRFGLGASKPIQEFWTACSASPA